jgi:branched-chain amino acid transport system permease protein
MINQLVNALSVGAIYSLFAMGLTLSWGVLKVLNLAHGSIFMLGTLAVYLFTEGFGSVPLPVALLIAFVAAGLLAVLLEVLAYAPIRRRASGVVDAELATLLASVGASGAIVGFAEMVTHHVPVGLPRDVFEIRPIVLGGLRLTNIQIVILVTSLAMVLLLAWFVRATRVGRAIRAVAEDPYMASLAGASPVRLATFTMFVSGAMAGVAGVLLAVRAGAFGATFGEPFLLKAFAVIILGGVGNIWGAVLGAFVLAFAETIVGLTLGGTYTDAVAFALILVLLLLRPQGLLPKPRWQRV